MKITLLKNTAKTLTPDSEHNEELFEKIGQGEVVTCEIKKVRNIRLHRKYFALIRMVYDNLPEHLDDNYPSIYTFRKQLEMYAGHIETFISLKGETMLMPKSIKYESLDGKAFEELFESVLQIIQKHIMPELSRDVVDSEIMSFF